MPEQFDGPPPEAIRAAVERIRSRRTKNPSKQKLFLTELQGSLFEHIIDTYLKGITARLAKDDLAKTLSEESLAVDCLEMDRSEFRRNNPPDVRTGLTNIRKGLISYYQENPEENILISIPKATGAHSGVVVGYIPQISWRLSRSAHRHFAQAMAQRERRTKTSLAKAVHLLKNILKEHPLDAPTKARLAEVYTFRMMHGISSADDGESGLHEALRLANEALRSSQNLWAGHIAKGAVHLCLFEWEEAEKEFQIALRLDEYDTRLQAWYFFYLMTKRKLPSAIQDLHEIASQEAISASVRRNLGLALMLTGDCEAAEDELKNSLTESGVHFLFRIYIGVVYYQNQKYDEAFDEASKAQQMPDSEYMSPGVWVLALARRDKGEAEKVMQRLLERKERRDPYLASSHLAIAYVGVGNYEAALNCLEEALKSHDPLVLFVPHLPMMSVLHNNQRFQAITRAVTFPETSA